MSRNPLSGPSPVNMAQSGLAVALFQQQLQDAVLLRPGSVRATRHELGFGPNQIAMLDIGGEGQKTSNPESGAIKSGNAHAININVQAVASPGTFDLHVEPLGAAQKTSGYAIPNLIKPAFHWPAEHAKAEGFLPFENGFSNLTMIEGAPLFDYHVDEMTRVTSPRGWHSLAVSDEFAPQLERLAKAHNGGTVWKFDAQVGPLNRYVIPPRSALRNAAVEQYRTMWEGASSHEAFDVVQTIALHQLSGQSIERATENVKNLMDENGEVDLDRVLPNPARAHHPHGL